MTKLLPAFKWSTKGLVTALFMLATMAAGEVAAQPAFLSQGLVAYYPFNGNAKDASGNGNDGIVLV